MALILDLLAGVVCLETSMEKYMGKLFDTWGSLKVFIRKEMKS